MKTLILILVLCLMPLALFAQTQTATWALTWQDTNTTHQGFNIERRLGQTGTFAKIGTSGPTVKAYNDVIANDPGNTTYCYRVAAYNTAGQSPYSNIACGTSPVVTVPPVNPPTGVTVAVTVTVTTQSAVPAAAAAAPQKAKGK